ncbi:unnamed protein product [Phaeothamnion confervicola]
MSGTTAMGESNVILLGMGNPLLDISADVPMSLLEKYSVALNNAILAEEQHLPLYKELIESYPVKYIAGGATQNSIRVAQWMMPQTPGATAYMGCVGADVFGDQLAECAAADGVITHYQRDAETPTGTCAVLVHGGERSLVANLSSANKFSGAHLETPAAAALIESSRVFYVAGFFLTVSVDAILKVGSHAAANRKIFALNLSAPFLVQFFADQMAAALPYADYVFGNESEAEALGEKKGWGKDIKEVALKLAATAKASGTRARTVVFTQGSGATVVAAGGAVTEFPVEPLAADKLVDTNGAGDAFVGGFLSQLVAGKELAECVRAGHFAARTVIQCSGCTFPAQCEFA